MIGEQFPWTDDLDDILRRNWATTSSLTALSRLIGCGPAATIRRAGQLGLPRRDWRSLRYNPILRPMRDIEIPRARQCQWPHGEVGKPGFRFCLEPVQPGFPYCPTHKARAYRKWERKDEEAA